MLGLPSLETIAIKHKKWIETIDKLKMPSVAKKFTLPQTRSVQATSTAAAAETGTSQAGPTTAAVPGKIPGTVMASSHRPPVPAGASNKVVSRPSKVIRNPFAWARANKLPEDANYKLLAALNAIQREEKTFKMTEARYIRRLVNSAKAKCFEIAFSGANLRRRKY